MTPLILAAAISLIGASDASQSVNASAPPQQAAQKSKDDPDRVICRSEPVTGSRFNKRVCLTKAQWADAAKQSEDEMHRIQETTGLGGGAGGGFSGR